VLIVVGVTALVGGSVAAISGFGIGSILTPIVALYTGTKLAVPLVSIPHFVGTGLRLWLLRAHIDRRVLFGFGLASAVGALVGALLHAVLASVLLTVVLAALLILAGSVGMSGASERIRFGGAGAWVAGGVSGLLGGLVGHQGGIRAGAMLGMEVKKEAFVATATAIALGVDIARLPVYAATHGAEMLSFWQVIAVGTFGVVVGTIAGGRSLRLLPEPLFRVLVSALLVALGIYLLLQL
jgi:uncharacterized membrane protein YfcA